MARIQLGKKEKPQFIEVTPAIEKISRVVLREIMAKGLGGVDVLPGVWVIERELQQHIGQTQQNLAEDISDDEILSIAKSVLVGLESKSYKSEEKFEARETLEKTVDIPKELPQIRMGNVSVVQFPEGNDKGRVPDGYVKRGRFYKKEDTKKKKRVRSKKQKDEALKEKQETLRRLKIRRGLFKETVRNPKGEKIEDKALKPLANRPKPLTPDQIRGRIERVGEQGREIFESLQDRATDVLNDGRRKVNEVKSKVKREGRERFEDLQERAQSAIEERREERREVRIEKKKAKNNTFQDVLEARRRGGRRNRRRGRG